VETFDLLCMSEGEAMLPADHSHLHGPQLLGSRSPGGFRTGGNGTHRSGFARVIVPAPGASGR
jgi:hypothetical protein